MNNMNKENQIVIKYVTFVIDGVIHSIYNVLKIKEGLCT